MFATRVTLGRLKLIATILVVGVLLATGGYRVVTGYWPLQAEGEREHPEVGNLDVAQEKVPFTILIPGSLPPGQELGSVAVLTRLPRGSRGPEVEVNGVSITYRTAEGLSLLIEQEIGGLDEGYTIGNAEKSRVVQIRGFKADLWQGISTNGRIQHILVWEEPGDIVLRLVSYLSEDDTLQVAKSLRPFK